MSIENVVKAINDYKALYAEAQNKIEGIRQNTELTQVAKDRRIADLESRYDTAIESSKADVIEVIKGYQSELADARLKKVEAGLKEADKITMMVNGIMNNDYDVPMIRDFIEIYNDNPVILDAIRGAVSRSDNPAVKGMVNDIPRDTTEELIGKLDKAINTMESAPRLIAHWSADDWGSALWKSGQGIDSLIDFILNLHELAEIIS